MKLHKLLVGGGMILALSAALFLGSCSNNSKGSEGDGGQQGGQQDGGDQGGQQGGDQGGQETAVTLTADKFQGDGDICKVTVDGEKLIIEHTERVANWEGFRMKETEDLGTSMSLKVTNLGADKAWVKVLVKKVEAGKDVDQITHYKIGNGEKKAMPFDKDNADGVPFTLEKTGDSQTITVWYTDSAAKLVVLVDCNPWAFGGSNGEDVDKKPKAGKIEISELKFTTASASTEEGEQGGEAGEQGEEGGEQGGQQDGEEDPEPEQNDVVTKFIGEYSLEGVVDPSVESGAWVTVVPADKIADVTPEQTIIIRIAKDEKWSEAPHFQYGHDGGGYYLGEISNCYGDGGVYFAEVAITGEKITAIKTVGKGIGLKANTADAAVSKAKVWVTTLPQTFEDTISLSFIGSARAPYCIMPASAFEGVTDAVTFTVSGGSYSFGFPATEDENTSNDYSWSYIGEISGTKTIKAGGEAISGKTQADIIARFKSQGLFIWGAASDTDTITVKVGE